MINLIKNNLSLFLKEAKNSLNIGDLIIDSHDKYILAKKIYDLTEQEEIYFLDRLQHTPPSLKCGFYALRLSFWLIDLGYKPKISSDSIGGIAVDVCNPFTKKKGWFKIYNDKVPKIFLAIVDNKDKELIKKEYVSFSYSSPKEWSLVLDDLRKNL